MIKQQFSIIFILFCCLSVHTQNTHVLPSIYIPPVRFNDTVSPNIVFQSQIKNPMSIQQLDAKCLSWSRKNFAIGPQDSLILKDSHIDSLTNIYYCAVMKQTLGLDIINSVAQLSMDRAGNVFSNGNCWIKNESQLVKRAVGISCVDAIKAAASLIQVPANSSNWKVKENGKFVNVEGVKFAYNNVTCEEAFYKTKSNGLRNIWSVVLDTDAEYLDLFVDKATGKVLASADWMSHISFDSDGNLHKRQARSVKYRITPFTGKDPKSSDRQLLVNPIDTFSSPNGWHGQSAVTIGNNVIATENSANVKGTRAILNNGQNARGTDDFTFDFAIDDKNQVPLDYTFASITNVFVLTNRFHDLFYRYGFTESAGNFQQNNFGKGGRDRDPVLAVVHDGSGRNNANFATPPDGQSGVMKMFVFDRTKPMRDGALENGIVNHELAHGLSARLTGGKAQGNCLNSPESGALGEGWSDAIAMAIEMSSNSKRTDNVAFGKYVTGNEIKGIRTLPYSTNIKTNPLKFSRGQQTEQVHTLGEVWASMLFDMYWNLVDKHGFDPQFATNPKGNGGNNKFLQLLVTGMKTQPCFPTFVTARNAILSADRLLFKSENLCEIWTAFARRGLGMRAVDDGSFIDDFTFPEGCEIPEPSNSGPGAMNSSAYQSYALSIVWFLFGAHALFYL